MLVYRQRSPVGRKAIGSDIREDIRVHCMSDSYTKIMPKGRHKVEARAFVVPVRDVYEDFGRRDELTYSTFRILVSGKKDSATPWVHSWLHVSDKCQTCPQRLTAIACMQKLTTEAIAATDDEALADVLANTVRATEESLDPTVGADELKAIEHFTTAVATNTNATTTKINELMGSICAIGHHVYQRSLVSKSWKDALANLASDGSAIYRSRRLEARP